MQCLFYKVRLQIFIDNKLMRSKLSYLPGKSLMKKRINTQNLLTKKIFPQASDLQGSNEYDERVRKILPELTKIKLQTMKTDTDRTQTPSHKQTLESSQINDIEKHAYKIDVKYFPSVGEAGKHIDNNGHEDKDKVLQKLLALNQKLTNQVQELEQFKQKWGNSALKKQCPIDFKFNSPSTSQGINKQLSNAQSKIKQLKAEIEQQKNINQANQPSKIIKLKGRLAELEKIMPYYQEKLKKLNKDIKDYEEIIDRLRNGEGHIKRFSQLTAQKEELEAREAQLQKNEEKRKRQLNRKQDYIRRLQKQLKQSGAPLDLFDQLKTKVTTEIISRKNTSTDKALAIAVMSKNQTQNPEKEHEKMKREIQILSKCLRDQEKMLAGHKNQLEKAEVNNENFRLQLESLNQQIDETEVKIGEIRKLMSPLNPKRNGWPTQDSFKNGQNAKQQIKEPINKKSIKKQEKDQQVESIDKSENQFIEPKHIIKKQNWKKKREASMKSREKQ